MYLDLLCNTNPLIIMSEFNSSIIRKSPQERECRQKQCILFILPAYTSEAMQIIGSALKFHNSIPYSSDQVIVCNWYQTRKDGKLPQFKVLGENYFRKSNSTALQRIFLQQQCQCRMSWSPAGYIAASFSPQVEQFTDMQILLSKFSSFPCLRVGLQITIAKDLLIENPCAGLGCKRMQLHAKLMYKFETD